MRHVVLALGIRCRQADGGVVRGPGGPPHQQDADIVVFLWRVAIHPGDAHTGHVADLYKEYAAKP